MTEHLSNKFLEIELFRQLGRGSERGVMVDIKSHAGQTQHYLSQLVKVKNQDVSIIQLMLRTKICLIP